MLRRTHIFLRRGKRRPKGADFESRWRHEPPSLKPQQGGQQMFESLLLQKANTRAKEHVMRSLSQFGQLKGRNSASEAAEISDNSNLSKGDQLEVLQHLHLPGVDGRLDNQENFEDFRRMDGFTDRRKFNPTDFYMDAQKAEKASEIQSITQENSDGNSAEGASNEPMSIHVFQEKFGCSMLKKWKDKTNFPSGDLDFHDNLDIWGEMPKYSCDMYFLYLVIRRRNTYAVIFDINGKCIHAPMSAGKVGLKNSDKGWRSEGSANTGNIVTSKYLDLVYPKLCLIEESQQRQKTGVHKGRRPIQVVLRVMGWYNGRQGALKALHDRKDKYHVSYFEDITPIPRNGPRMPKLKRR